MDLIKAILLELEKNTPERAYDSENFEIEGFSPAVVHFHLYLMEDAGLISAMNVAGHGGGGHAMIPRWVSWNGYEFLDAARNDGVWNKAKGILSDKGLGMGFDVLKQLLLKLAQEGIA